MTHRKILSRGLVILALAVLLVCCVVANRAFCEGTAGIGISDYEQKVTVQDGKSEIFEIAGIKNEGTLSWNFSVNYIPDANSTDGNLTIHYYTESYHLNSGDYILLKGQVTSAAKAGNYSGKFQISTVVEPQGNGNPSSPGGSAHATFNVESTASPTLLVVVVVLAIAVSTTSVASLFIRKRRRNHE